MRRLLHALPLLMLAPFPAWAHAILMESQPQASATVTPGPQHLVLRFNSRIDAGRSRIELRGGPAGTKPVEVKLSPAPAPDVLVADTTLSPGDWVLRWQVLAVDGHLTRGDIPLTVKAP